LLLLADAARFADDRAAATYAFRALIERFPKDRRAGDAIFALGVLTLESEAEMPQAARRFEDYLSRWPDGPLAREAQGRLIEALWRAGNTAEARRAAANYQQRHPDGPHAGLAQRVLAGPP
ncbi:MAG TPA: tetratricopeptide repeat protein, partial [Polyangia bacterium]